MSFIGGMISRCRIIMFSVPDAIGPIRKRFRKGKVVHENIRKQSKTSKSENSPFLLFVRGMILKFRILLLFPARCNEPYPKTILKKPRFLWRRQKTIKNIKVLKLIIFAIQLRNDLEIQNPCVFPVGCNEPYQKTNLKMHSF